MNEAVELFKPTNRRLKMLRVSLAVFGELLFNTRLSPDKTKILAVEIEGLPEDVQLQAFVLDFATQQVLMRLWSPSFPLVPEGCCIPELKVELRRREYHVTIPTDDNRLGFVMAGSEPFPIPPRAKVVPLQGVAEKEYITPSKDEGAEQPRRGREFIWNMSR